MHVSQCQPCAMKRRLAHTCRTRHPQRPSLPICSKYWLYACLGPCSVWMMMFDGCMLGFLVVRIMDTGFRVAGPVCLQGHQQKGAGRPLQGHTAVGWVIAQGGVSVIAAGWGCCCTACPRRCQRLWVALSLQPVALLLHGLSYCTGPGAGAGRSCTACLPLLQ